MSAKDKTCIQEPYTLQMWKLVEYQSNRNYDYLKKVTFQNWFM